MGTGQFGWGRLVLLFVVVAVVAGAAVEAVRTVPDPNLFTSATGTIISLAVVVAAMAAIVLPQLSAAKQPETRDESTD